MSKIDFDADSLRDAGLDPVERAAAEWTFRRQRGLSAEDERAFSQWVNEAPEHAKVFAEMNETEHLLDGIRIRSAENIVPFPPTAVSRRRLPVLSLALAAAAAFAVGFVAWRQWKPTAVPFVQSAVTQVGGSSRLELPDGSVVRLNTDTEVEVNYVAAERRIKLVHGEAYFTVAKDSSRPFWVQAGPVAVRAVGTAFNIRIRPDAVNVLVTEGKVRVVEGDHAKAPVSQPPDTGAMLTMGHLAKVSLDVSHRLAAEALIISAVQPRAIESAMAWQEGRLEFIETPLAEVVSEFNRYNRHKIVIADPILAARRFGGAFASHQIEPLLEVLEQSFSVVAEERQDETVLRLAK
jgi:transmembrane sensor